MKCIVRTRCDEELTDDALSWCNTLQQKTVLDAGFYVFRLKRRNIYIYIYISTSWSWERWEPVRLNALHLTLSLNSIFIQSFGHLSIVNETLHKSMVPRDGGAGHSQETWSYGGGNRQGTFFFPSIFLVSSGDIAQDSGLTLSLLSYII